MGARMMPGPELDELVRKRISAYDEWELKQRSRGCRDDAGGPMTKPPPMLAGMGKSVASERWLEMWIQLVQAHDKHCVKCRTNR